MKRTKERSHGASPLWMTKTVWMIKKLRKNRRKGTIGMKKIMWVLVGMIMGEGVHAGEAAPASRIEAARLMYEVALEKNKAKTSCIEKAQKLVSQMQSENKNLTPRGA